MSITWYWWPILIWLKALMTIHNWEWGSWILYISRHILDVQGKNNGFDCTDHMLNNSVSIKCSPLSKINVLYWNKLPGTAVMSCYKITQYDMTLFHTCFQTMYCQQSIHWDLHSILHVPWGLQDYNMGVWNLVKPNYHIWCADVQCNLFE